MSDVQPSVPYGTPYSGRGMDPRTALQFAVQSHTAKGWRVEAISDSTATLASGQKPNHTLHAIITFFTCLLWAPVWIIIGLTTYEQQLTITVTPDGQVFVSKPVRR